MGEVHVLRDGGVVTLVLDNPGKKNAISNAMWHALEKAFVDVAGSASDRVLVITGAGGDFCAGVEMAPESSATHRTQLERLQWMNEKVLALHELTIPTIASVDGVAAGMGMNLALSADLIVASETARFSEIFIQRALSVDGGGTWLLPRLVGLAKAKELCFFGDFLSTPEAAALGIVNKVVSTSELESTSALWAARLARGPRLALATTKALLQESSSTTFRQSLENEARVQCSNISGPDFGEAIDAFRSRREPHF